MRDGRLERPRSLTPMSDGSIRERISNLVHEEHTLRDRLSSHEISPDEEHARLRDLEINRLRIDGHTVQETDLSHLSPCRYEHINPTASTPSM